MEGLVGVIALVAATSLLPGDYFAINVDQAKINAPTVVAQAAPGQDITRAKYAYFAEEHSIEGFDIREQKLEELTQQTGEKNLRGRTGGAVTLAVGIAQIFSGLPGMNGLM
jgi:carbon starvation protein